MNVLVQGAWLKLSFQMKISESVNSQVGVSVRGSRAGLGSKNRVRQGSWESKLVQGAEVWIRKKSLSYVRLKTWIMSLVQSVSSPKSAGIPVSAVWGGANFLKIQKPRSAV